MKPACKPIGASLQTSLFARLDKDELRATGKVVVTRAAAQPTWVIVLIGLAAVGVVSGATAGILVAVGGGNNAEVSSPPSPPPSPPSSTDDAQRGMATPDVSIISRANEGRRLEASLQQARSPNNGGRRLTHTQCDKDNAACNLEQDGINQAYNEIRVGLFAPCIIRRLRPERYVGQGLQNVTEYEYDEHCVATLSAFTVDAECIDGNNVCPFSAHIRGKFDFMWRGNVNNDTHLNVSYSIEAEESDDSFGEFSIAANYGIVGNEESMNVRSADGVVTMIRQHGRSNGETVVNKILLEKRGSTASDTYALQGTTIYSASFRSYTAPAANFTPTAVDTETPTYVVAFLSSNNVQTVCVKRDYTTYANPDDAALGCSSGCFPMLLNINSFTLDVFISSVDGVYSSLQWPAGACTA